MVLAELPWFYLLLQSIAPNFSGFGERSSQTTACHFDPFSEENKTPVIWCNPKHAKCPLIQNENIQLVGELCGSGCYWRRLPTLCLRLLKQTEVEAPDDRVGIVDCDRPYVGKRLDLGRHLLELVIGHAEAQLGRAGLDSVPAGKTGSEVDVTCQAEVCGVEDLVCAGVVEDRLGVDAGLVGKGTEPSDGVVEGGVDLHGLGYHILNLLGLAMYQNVGLTNVPP